MLAALICLAIQGPDLDKPISLRTAATPVSEILSAVTKQAGFTFVADHVRDWPVIVSVKDLPVRELLEQLAEVTDAEWRKEERQWTLERGTARVKRAADGEVTERAERLRPLIDALPTQMSAEEVTKALAQAKNDIRGYGGSGTTPVQITGGPSPALELIYWLLKRLPIRDLAVAPINSFVSYSSFQRPGQLALPTIPSEVWRRYLATRAEFAKSLEVPEHVTIPAGMAKLPMPDGVRVSLLLSRPNAMADVIATVCIYGPEGQLLDLARHTLSLPAAPIEPSEAPVSGAIAFSEESIRFLRVLLRPNGLARWALGSTQGETMWVSEADPWLSDANRDVVRKAIEREPTSLHISDWVLGLGDKVQKNVVAHVPDHAFGSLTELMNGPTPDHSLLWKSLPRFGIEATITGDSLVIKPKVFARADRYRVDRAALRKFVVAAGPFGWPKLQDYMAYAVAAPSVTTNLSLDNLLLEPILYRRMTGLTDPSQVMALRLMSQWRAQSPTEEVLRHGDAVRRFGPSYEQLVRVSVAPQMSYLTRSTRREPLQEVDFDPFALHLGEETPVLMERVHRFEGAMLTVEGGAPQVLSPRTLGMFFGLKLENFTGLQPVLLVKGLHPASVIKRTLDIRAGRTGQAFHVFDADVRTSETININQLPADWQEAFEEGKRHASNISATQNTRATPPPE